MIFAVYAGENDESIKNNLGMPDYSYYFVMKSYLPVLAKMGSVFIVNSLAQDSALLEQLNQECCEAGEKFIFLSFTPPHITGVSSAVPSVTVFAWEYSTIPQEAWGGDIQHDWRYALRQQGRAITHSQYAVAAVREAMGDSFPVVSVPAPIWDTFANKFQPAAATSARARAGTRIRYHGCLLDSRALDLEDLSIDERDDVLARAVADKLSPDDHEVSLEGVIYTSVMNPIDGRKNWTDMVWAFCWAFREHEDATLLIKVTHYDVHRVWTQFIREFYKLQPFKCRVVLLHGFLEQEAYDDLIAATSYVVNCAYGEGQCLPLMEYMSAGIPAIAPNHTAMADYINGDNAFIVKSSYEWIHWPHDPRLNFRAFRYRIDWESLYHGYLSSYDIAINAPEKYRAMSGSASRDLRGYCSRKLAISRLATFFDETLPTSRPENRLQDLRRRISWLFGGRRSTLQRYASRFTLYRGETGTGSS